jgi:hypothetical protein
MMEEARAPVLIWSFFIFGVIVRIEGVVKGVFPGFWIGIDRSGKGILCFHEYDLHLSD